MIFQVPVITGRRSKSSPSEQAPVTKEKENTSAKRGAEYKVALKNMVWRGIRNKIEISEGKKYRHSHPGSTRFYLKSQKGALWWTGPPCPSSYG